MKYLICLLAIILVLSTTLHKEQNEFGKWKKFHNIYDGQMIQTVSESKMKYNLYDFDLSKQDKSIFNSFFIFSDDSSSFIDLDSYSLVLEKDKSGNLFTTGGGVDINVQVVNRKSNCAISVLFCGTRCYPETALWRNESWLEIYGFELNDHDKFIPTIWKFLLDKTLFSKYRIDRIFDVMPNSYVQSVRLKDVEFRE